jgi:Flp pilus assembly protein TadD
LLPWLFVAVLERNPQERVMKNAASRQEQYQARLGVVSMLVDAGRAQEALDRMRTIVDADPEMAIAHNDLAVIYYQTGQLAEARDAIVRAAERCPDEASLATIIRDNFEAIEAALRTADPATAYQACLTVVNGLLAKDELTLAIAEIERFVAGYPAGSGSAAASGSAGVSTAIGEAWNDLAVLHQAIGRVQPAAIASGIAVEIDPAKPDYRRTRAAILLEAGDWEEAGKVIAPVLVADPDDVDALILAGDIGIAAGQPMDARLFFRRALTIDPACGRAALQLAGLPEATAEEDTGPAETLVLIFSAKGAASVDQTLRTFARHCQDKSQVDVKVLYKAQSPEDQRLYHDIASEHPFVTLVCQSDFSKQLGALLAPHRHVLLINDDAVFVRDFRLTDGSRALDTDPRAIGCALSLGENATVSQRSGRAQRIPTMSRFAHGLYRFAWGSAEHDFGRPLTASSVLYRADELRRLLGTLTFANPPSLDAALQGVTGRFASTRPTMLCFDRVVAAPRASLDGPAPAATFRSPLPVPAPRLAV